MTLGGFLIAHGSALILPLSVIEGPVVTVITGFLAAQGYFDWRWAFFLLVCGDLVGDVIYYWIGRTGITPLRVLGRRVGVRGTISPHLQQQMRHNTTRMLLIGKWTHSIGCLVLAGAGMLRVPLPRFLLVNLFATLPKSAVLLGVGYFSGEHIAFFEHHAVFIVLALTVVGVSSVALILGRTDHVWGRR